MRQMRPLQVYVNTSFDGHLRTECDLQAVVWKQLSSIVESRKNQEIKPYNRSPWPQQVGRAGGRKTRSWAQTAMEETANHGCGRACGFHLSMDSLEEPLNNLSNPSPKKRLLPCRETRCWWVVSRKQSKTSKGLTFIKFSDSLKVCSFGRNDQYFSPSNTKTVSLSLNNLDHLVTNDMLKRKNLYEYVSGSILFSFHYKTNLCWVALDYI